MSIKTVDLASAPASRSYGATRSIAEYEEVLKLSRTLPQGKVITVQFSKEQMALLGGKNPLNTFAQAIRNAWRTSDGKNGEHQRIAYTVKPDKVCVKHGTPRVNQARVKKAASAKTAASTARPFTA